MSRSLIRYVLLCLLIAAVPAPLRAAKTVKWASPAEFAAWEKIAQRFSGEPEYKRDRNGVVEQIEVKEFRLDSKAGGWARVRFDGKTGHVVEISSDRAGFTNEEFQLFQPFSQLQRLTLWHNSNFHDREAPIEQFDASGLKYLKDLKHLERITLAGGGFDDAGMRAAAEIPQLKYLGMWHVRVSDAGMSALRNHPGLEEIRLGPFWGELMTDATLAHLATCPRLKKISIGETWLTYENGLKALEWRETPLQSLDLSNTLIAPEDVDRLRRNLSGTEIKWGGLAAAGQVLTESNWHRGKAEKWMPAELISAALEAAKSNPAEEGD